MKAKKLISTLMVLIMIVSTISAVGIASADAAAPSITLKEVTNLTNNNAQINATVNNPSKAKITKVGFQLGTKSGSWSTTKSESLNRTNGFSVWYSMNKWYGKLKSNQTYYYRFFITTGGKDKYSSIGSFKTKSDIPTITVNGVTNKTHNNAQINAKVSNPYKLKVTKVGFQIGTKSGTWLATKSESINKTTDFTTWYLMSKWYGTLKASTTYYYRFFITVGGKDYYSSIKSFKTDSVNTSTNKYPQIKALSISRIYQPKNDPYGYCLKLSTATAYAYVYKNYRTAGKDIAYTSTMVNNWSTHNKQVYNGSRSNLNLQTVYENLKKGIPVVVYYYKKINGYNYGHASVIIGYNGNTSKLEEKGFTVMEIKKESNVKLNSKDYFTKYANSPQSDYYSAKSCYVRLDSWLNYVGKYYGSLNTVRVSIPTK